MTNMKGMKATTRMGREPDPDTHTQRHSYGVYKLSICHDLITLLPLTIDKPHYTPQFLICMFSQKEKARTVTLWGRLSEAEQRTGGRTELCWFFLDVSLAGLRDTTVSGEAGILDMSPRGLLEEINI